MYERRILIRHQDWLGALEVKDSEYNKYRKLQHEGTCGWILETKEFRALMNGEQKHLWVHGKPGTYSIQCSSERGIEW